MKSKAAQSTIIVQKYEYGKPFPGLYGQFDGIPKLPKGAQLKCVGAMGPFYAFEGGMTVKFGIVSTVNHGLVMVADGEYMQVTGEDKEGTDGYNRPQCIGRVPAEYKV